MKPKLILCLALVLSGGLFGCSTAVQHSVAPKQNASAKQYFEDYLNQCGTNEIRCLWFLQDNPNIGMVMTINLDERTVDTVRDVYDWAQQGGGTHKLEYFQAFTLKQIANSLPPSDKNIEFNRSILISIRKDDKVEVFQYDRRHISTAIQRIYDISGGYLDK